MSSPKHCDTDEVIDISDEDDPDVDEREDGIDGEDDDSIIDMEGESLDTECTVFSSKQVDSNGIGR